MGVDGNLNFMNSSETRQWVTIGDRVTAYTVRENFLLATRNAVCVGKILQVQL